MARLAARDIGSPWPQRGRAELWADDILSREHYRPYVAVSPARAVQDWLLPRLWSPARLEAYYLPFAKAAKAAVDIPVILVGGVRSTGPDGAHTSRR